MQHSKKNRTLSRTKSQREALLRGLSISLLEKGKIKTTIAKAKELRPFVEKIITAAKKDSLASRRNVSSSLGQTDAKTVKNLFENIAPKYQNREGGYTRVIKMGKTKSGRDEAVIELVE